MKFNTILNRHIFLEMLPPFGINLLFFTIIFLITRILQITNLVVNYQVSLLAFVKLLLFSMPYFLAFTMPMSVMMAVLLTFLRMSADNEITVLKACGMNPNRFLLPVATFCIAGWLATGMITMVGLPWGISAYKQLSLDLARSHVDAVIKERTFIDSFEGLTLYINKLDLRTHTLKDVFINDQRSKESDNVIVAPEGRILSDPDAEVIRLLLRNGTINRVDLNHKSAHTIAFDSYEMNLDINQMLEKDTGRNKSIKAMSVKELKAFIRTAEKGSKDYYKAQMKFYEKFTLPVACFALGLVAIPLGIRARRGRRATGTVLGIILFLLYYILLTLAKSLGESGALPPVIGMWMPNIVIGGIGLYLYIRMIRERPLVFRLRPVKTK